MRKFTFSLDRVLVWRSAQLRLEEIKLERLYAELHSIDASHAAYRTRREEAESAVRGQRDVSGLELDALGNYQIHLAAESQRAVRARAECEQRIAAQIKILTGQRRNVKLLEKLKQQRLAMWTRDQDREIAEQASDAHMAKWNRGNIQ